MDILTIWCPEDGGKSEVDARGGDCARICREDLVEECLAANENPRLCPNLCKRFNMNHRKPEKSKKNSRLVDREAIHLEAADIQALRYEMPAFATLVITLCFDFERFVIGWVVVGVI